MNFINRKISIENIVVILWVSIVTILFFLFIKYDYISFEQNDDMFISTIPSGIYGQHYAYTFNNVLQGSFMAVLSKLIPICNWTIMLYTGYIYISYIGIGVWSIKTKGVLIGVSLSVLFLVTTYHSLLLNMNFSKTGGILICVGLAGFIHYARESYKKETSIFLFIFGCMIFAGSLSRYSCIRAAFPLIVILLMNEAMWCKNRNVKVLKLFLPWLILLLCIEAAWLGNEIAYEVDDEWREYIEFNNVRGNLDDYGMLDYETHQEIYQKIGYNDIDVKMLSSWHSADSEVFSAENLQEIIRNKTPKEYSLANIKQCLKETYTDVIKNNYMFGLIVTLTLICGAVNRKKLWLLIPNFLLLFLELFYLVWGGRYPERATLLAFLYAFSVIAYAFPEKEEAKGWKRGIVTITLTILIATALYHNVYEKITEESYVKEYPYKEEYRQFLADISEQQENLYVWDIFAIEKVLEGAYTPYEAFDFGVLSNSVYTGGWFVNTPIMANNAESFGEKNNPYKLLANSRNVFLVTRAGTDINDTLSYIRRHYNENAKSKCIAELNEIVVYSFAEE